MAFLNIFPKEEEFNEFELSKSLVILEFILMAYIKFTKTEYIDLLGVGLNDAGEYNNLVIYSYSEKQNKFEKQIISRENKRIHYAQAYDFDISGELTFLIVFKISSHKYNYKLIKNGKLLKYVDNSKCIPFLFLHPTTGQILIMDFNGSENKIYKLENEKIHEIGDKAPHIEFDSKHSSAFVDVTGNLKSECIFVENGSDGIKLKIFSDILEGNQLIFQVNLPVNLSAILFGDLRAKGHIDLFYVEKRGEEYFLIIYFNSGKENQPFLKSTEINLSLKLKLEKNDQIIFTCDDLEGLRTGPVLSYVDKTQFPNICLPIKRGNKIEMRTIKYEKLENEYVLTEVKYKIAPVENLVSLSFADVQNRQDDFLIINHNFGNNKFYLSFYEKRFGKRKNFMKCVSSYVKNNKINHMAIPGMNYKFEIHADKMTLKSVQIPQTSFLHLSSPYSLVGLNVISILVDRLSVGTFPPYSDKIYEIASKSVPNSFLAFNFNIEKKTIILNLYLRLDYMKNLLMIVFACILITNILIVIILRYRENKKIKEMNFQRDRGNIYVAF